MNNKEKLIKLDEIAYEFDYYIINNKHIGWKRNNVIEIPFNKLKCLPSYQSCFPQHTQIDKLINENNTDNEDDFIEYFWITVNLNTDNVKIFCPEQHPKQDIVVFQEKYFEEVYPLLEEYLTKIIKEKYDEKIRFYDNKMKRYNQLLAI